MWRKIDPELGILLAEADSRRPRLQFDDSDRGEQRLIETRCRIDVAYRDR